MAQLVSRRDLSEVAITVLRMDEERKTSDDKMEFVTVTAADLGVPEGQMCQCQECYCVDEADMPCGELFLCGCCMADCPDVHPWNNIGCQFWASNMCPSPPGWQRDVEITAENALTLGPRKRKP